MTLPSAPAVAPALATSVVVPTYRRPDALTRCLAALAAQEHAPDEIVIVMRRDDEQTRAVVDGTSLNNVVVVEVEVPGQVQALNAGRGAARGDILAFTDDDARPRPDWLARIVAWFAADTRIGGVGGRDVVFHSETGTFDEGNATLVGRILPFGRIVGNHHYRAEAQEVHMLKGANMAFRRDVLGGFDETLRGRGAQVHNDLEASLRVVAGGHRLVWDPSVTVDHEPAPRFDADRRNRPEPSALVDRCHNEAYAMLNSAPRRLGIVAFLYGILVGTRSAPGLVVALVSLARGDRAPLSLLRLALSGRLAGARTALGPRRMTA